MITILLINVFVKIYDILSKYICKYGKMHSYQYLHVFIKSFNPVIEYIDYIGINFTKYHIDIII